MKRFIALMALVTTAALAREHSCKRNDSEVFEDIQCALEARDEADRDLNATYQRLLAALTPAEAETLRKAQRAWLAYVEAEAKFALKREGDGSSGRLMAVNVREKLTRERIEALKAWVPR